MMRSLFLPGILLSLLLPFGSAAAEILIKGRVFKSLHEPLPDAIVVILEARKRALTDERGFFRIRVPRPGFYTFRIIRGAIYVQTRRRVHAGGGDITLYDKQPRKTKETRFTRKKSLVVSGRKRTSAFSRYQLDRDEIKRMPGVMGDSLRAIYSLPGIIAVPEVGIASTSNVPDFFEIPQDPVFKKKNSRRGVLTMRGAPSRSSRFYADGMLLPFPFHLGDQSSVLNNDYIRKADIFSGSYSARFGNSIGGVIDIHGPEFPEKAFGHLNSSLFLSDIYYQTPLFGKKGYILGSARQAYQNKVIDQIELTPPRERFPATKLAEYSDGQYKFGVRLGRSQSVQALFLWARDIADTGRGFIGFAPDLAKKEFNRSFQVGGVVHEFIPGRKFKNKFTAQVTKFKELNQNVLRNILTREVLLDYNAVDERRIAAVSNDAEWTLLKNSLYFKFGARAENTNVKLYLENLKFPGGEFSGGVSGPDAFQAKVNSDRRFRALADGDQASYAVNSAYGEFEWQLKNFRFVPGVRAEYYSLARQFAIEPRVATEFALKKNRVVLYANAGRHFGAPSDLAEISARSGNPGLNMEEAEKVAGGVRWNFAKDWVVKLEGFRNIYRKLVVQDDYILNPFSVKNDPREIAESPEAVLADPLENRPLFFSNDGDGYSKGVEIFIKKTRKSLTGFFGWLSYTYSHTKRNNHQPFVTPEEMKTFQERNKTREAIYYTEVNRGPFIAYNDGSFEYFRDNDTVELYDYDRTHQLNLVVSYRFDRRWQVGSRFRYMTNTPLVPIVNSRSVELPNFPLPIYMPVYSDRYNSGRLKPVHQLDIRLDRFFNYAWGFANFYLEFINLYARKNPTGESFNSLYPYLRGEPNAAYFLANPNALIPRENPAILYEATVLNTGGKRAKYFPMFNMGLEMRF